MYYIASFFVSLISILPFWVLHGLADFSYLLVYYVVGYRKKVVRENLLYSFPEKTEKERRKIERRFYRHFCDLFFEALKLKNISGKKIDKRMRYINTESVKACYDQNRCVMLLTSHYGNWEWLSTFSRYLPKDKPVYQAYKQQKDGVADRVIYNIRQRFGAKNIESRNLYRTLVHMRDEGKLGMFGMISDQSPNKSNLRYWTTFLNQLTPMIDGTEQIARKFNYPVYYGKVNKVKRGYYTCTLQLISENPKDMAEHEITEQYARLLEQDIKNQPEYWLWSHKRWKHSPDRQR